MKDKNIKILVILTAIILVVILFGVSLYFLYSEPTTKIITDSGNASEQIELESSSSDEVISETETVEIIEELESKTDVTPAITNDKISFKELEKPAEIKEIQDNIEIRYETEKTADDKIKISAFLQKANKLKKDEIINHISQELVYENRSIISDIQLNAIQGFAFPSDDVEISKYRQGNENLNKMVVTIIDMDIDYTSNEDVLLYELTFSSSPDLTSIDFKNTELKTGTHVIEKEDSSINLI